MRHEKLLDRDSKGATIFLRKAESVVLCIFFFKVHLALTFFDMYTPLYLFSIFLCSCTGSSMLHVGFL